MLYSTELRGGELAQALDDLAATSRREPARHDILEFAHQVGSVVAQRSHEIDQAIAQASPQWPLERMPAVDRAVLRLACAELMAFPHTPTAVIIAEAGALGSEYSTDDSRGFIQGVLGTVAKTLRP